MSYAYVPLGNISLDPSSMHWNSDMFSKATKYYIYCKAECSFQKYGFCTCVTGHCFTEENEGKFQGMETRMIIDIGV